MPSRLLRSQHVGLVAVALVTIVSRLPVACADDEKGFDSSQTLQQTIDRLEANGKTSAAKFLAERQAYAFKQHRRDRGWSFIFGRIIVNKPDNPQFCDAQMAIHPSGWFLGSVGDTKKPVGFRMWGYHPAEVLHGGKDGSIVNVGDITLKPFLFDELATVRAEVLLERKADPDLVSVRVTMESPKTNSASGGTNGYLQQPEKEMVRLDKDWRVQKTGLSPFPHYIHIKAPGHLPFRRKFDLQSGGTADLGVLRIAASPKFEIEFAIAETPDFSEAKRHREVIYAGDRFRTNDVAAEWDWVKAGQLGILERDREYTLHCGLYGLIVTDLGEGTLEDFPKYVPPKDQQPNRERQKLKDGHVYLISHRSKDWKHWTLLRVSFSSSTQVPAKSSDQDAK